LRKILISLLTIALIGGLAGGSLFAYFSDTEISDNIVFSAGTIQITLDGDIGAPVHGTVALDWKPCQTGYLVYTITNTGKNSADVWKHIYDIRCEDGWTSDAEQGEPEDNDIDKAILFGMWIENSGDYHDFVPGVDKMLVDENEGFTVDAVECKFIYLAELAPAASINIVQTFHIKANTTNWAQGDLMTFNEEFVAQQTSNPSPPGEELPGHGKP